MRRWQRHFARTAVQAGGGLSVFSMVLIFTLTTFVATAGVVGGYTYLPQRHLPTPSLKLTPKFIFHTFTTCPRPGTARAAVIAPFILDHPNIVSIDNAGQGKTATATLSRYDIVTHQSIHLVLPANGIISDAQVSTDGQWVLFVSTPSGQHSHLQMVRVDGQGLQTLYCSSTVPSQYSPSSLVNAQWSPDQHSIVFVDEYTPAPGIGGDYYPAYLYLLNASNGKLQKLSPNALGIGNTHFAWLDNTRMYALPLMQTGAPVGIDILDVNHGGVPSTIVPNTTSTSCMDFAGGYNGANLFISRCNSFVGQTGGVQGPSTVTEQSPTGGTATTIYTNPTFAITSLCVATATTLLLLIENSGGNNMSHNGLWKMNMDGSGLTQLASDPVKTSDPTQVLHLNQFSKYPWANVSRDGRWYALTQNKTLILGSMNGGPFTTFATLSPFNDNSVLSPSGIVGWTSSQH